MPTQAQAGLGFAPYREKLPLIQALIDKALAINPVHTLARDVKAQIRFYVDHDFQGAIDESTKLIQEDPRLLNNYGNQLSNLGQFDMAMGVLDQALKLDPLSPLVLESRGLTLLSAGRFSEAHAAFKMREFRSGIPRAFCTIGAHAERQIRNSQATRP